MRSVSIENGSGGSSPGCISSAAQSMVVPSSRGGVPVLSRPSAKPAAPACRTARAPAPRRPGRPGSAVSPIWMRPRRNVPVVSTTAPAASARPSARRTPATAPVGDDEIVGLAFDHRQVRRSARIARLHRGGVELAVGLGARAAHRRALAAVEHAELDAAGSATRPIRPSSASISRTRWPLPSPPIAGLQDIAPMVAKRWVTSAVRAPMRAAAAAASQPAWPPPMTMTSKRLSHRHVSRNGASF